VNRAPSVKHGDGGVMTEADPLLRVAAWRWPRAR